jgi:uncharacterized protein YkwD
LHLELLEDRRVLSGIPPTAVEQLMLEQLNDARANPAAYGASIGLDLSGVAPSQPLAWDPRLIQAALGHSQDMNDRNYFSHVTPDGIDPGARIAAAGFAASSYGESIAAGYATPDAALSALIIDNGVSNLGHRRHLLAIDAVFRDQNAVGIGIVQNGSGTYQDYYTIDTALGADTRPFLTGVVYTDANHNGKYDIGEGLGGVTVTVQGAGSVTTFDTGGYSLQVNPGTYTVTFSGGGLGAPVTQTVSIGAGNYRLNVTPGGTSQASAPVGTPDANTTWLTQTYQSLLGRSPGPNDLAYWLGQLQSGVSRDAVVATIQGSPEFQRTDNSRWLAQIYPSTIGRSAGANDLNYWLGVLGQGASRQDVVGAMMNSVEYRRFDGSQWLPGTYQTLLGRAPKDADFAYWLNVLGSGATHDQVIANIVSSAEFAAHAGGQSAGWVDLAYVDLLSRHAGPGDLNYWLGVLSGTDRATAALQMMQSAEYQASAWRGWITQLYANLLGRNPGSTDLAYWMGVWQAGGTQAAVLTIFLNSPEYRAHSAQQTG